MIGLRPPVSEKGGLDELLKDDLGAYVTYLVLLRLRSWLDCDWISSNKYIVWLGSVSIPSGEEQRLATSAEERVESISSIIQQNLAPRLGRTFIGKELDKALSFISSASRLLLTTDKSLTDEVLGKAFNTSDECRQANQRLLSKLEEIESEKYDRLKEGYEAIVRQLLSRGEIKGDLLERLSDVLRGIRRNEIGGVVIWWFTRTGSRYVETSVGSELVGLFDEMAKANLMIKVERFYYLIPASLFEPDFVSSVLAPPQPPKQAPSATVIAIPPLRPVDCKSQDFSRLPPSREALEGLVARILQAFGFNATTDVQLPTRTGTSGVEVDVWATRGDLRVYVSCKNWNRDVDRSVVDEEFGRVNNLRDIPHLRVLVVSTMSDEARRTAISDGFYVVELGAKATAQNLVDACEALQDRLTQLFVSMAPPQLAQAYNAVEGLRAKVEELARSVEELRRLLAPGQAQAQAPASNTKAQSEGEAPRL